MIAHHAAPTVLHSRRPNVRVFGPAYIDRVLLVDAPLREGGVIDGSVEGALDRSDSAATGRLALVCPDGAAFEIDTPDGWPGPFGVVRISEPPGRSDTNSGRHVRGLAWHDDLGGMGAGYASALAGTLVSALGDVGDPTSRAVVDLLASHGVDHRPLRIAGRPADWTLLVTSGAHGDKLAVGFRGCHASQTPSMLSASQATDVDLIVVAGFSTALSDAALETAGAETLRVLAPAMRTMRDEAPTIGSLAGRIDLLACNRTEWEAAGLEARSRLRGLTPLISVTDGPAGARLLMDDRELLVSAFPRARPPRDTNRAGEAFASTLIARLWNAGWRRGLDLDPAIVQEAATAATAAAALVLDLDRFGFPSPSDIDAAMSQGIIM